MSEKNIDENEKDEAEEVRESQICSNCGEKNPVTNLFCNFCGHHFVEKINCVLAS